MITIYTKKNCEKCEMIKKTLKSKNIKFIEKSADSPEGLMELIDAGITLGEAPVVEKNGKFLTNKDGLLKIISEK